MKKNKKNMKLLRNRKKHDYASQKNDEMLYREKVMLDYDMIRSNAENYI